MTHNPPNDDTHISRNSRHIESRDKKQSKWKCNHIRSTHRATHDIASEVCIASRGASVCISRRDVECGDTSEDLERSKYVYNSCCC